MRKTSKRVLQIIVPLIFSLTTKWVVAQTVPLDIKKAIDIALTNNRSLRADSLELAITDNKNKEIAGRYRPQLSVNSSTEYNPAIPSQLLPGEMVGQPSKDYVPVKFGTRYNMKTGVEATQTIYRKDLLLQMKSAGLQNNISKTKYNLSREELVYQVAATFYALQTNAELIRTTTSDYLNMKDILRIAKAQYENGVLKRIDYESLEINVANTKSQLDQLETDYSAQLAQFNFLLGIPAENKTMISSSISKDLRYAEEENFLLQREDIRLSQQLIQLKEVELKTIRAEKAPSINSYFRYGYQSQFDKPGNALKSDYIYKSSTLGISMSISILDGSRRKSRMNTARIQLEQLNLNSQQQKEQASMELLTATGTLKNNREQYAVTSKNLDLASKVFNSRRALYTEGVATLIELLDAERELSRSRSLHIQSQINVQTAWLDVHKAKGTLLTEFLKSI